MTRKDDPHAVCERLRVAHLLDCVPGHANRVSGQQIVIIKLAYLDEIEPIMLSKYDAERLLVSLLVSLQTHGDTLAKDLLDKYFTAEADPNDVFRTTPSESDPDPLISRSGRRVAYPVSKTKYIPLDHNPCGEPLRHPVSSNPSPKLDPLPRDKPWRKRLTERKTSICKCTVQYTATYRPRNRFFILGGYSDGTSHFVLARRRATNGGCEDGIARVFATGQIEIWGDGTDWLPDEEWNHFLSIPKGKQFVFNEKQWTKMTVESLATLVHGRTFKCIKRP